MSWNYRLIKFTDTEGVETHRAIHEVYYDKNMTPTAYSCNPTTVSSIDESEPLKDLKWLVTRMREALEKECLSEDDFKF